MRDLRLSTPAGLVVLASVAGCEHGGVVQPPPPRSAAHYVSPTGSAAGDGSSAQPWDLATALAGAAGKVQPGDTIWLRGGIYSPGAPLVSTVAGVAGKPVVVRRYAAGRAVVDATALSGDSVRPEFFIWRGDCTPLVGPPFTDSQLNPGPDHRPHLHS